MILPANKPEFCIKEFIIKIAVTGSLGNISKPLSKSLINNGHEVTIISSNREREAEIRKLGALPAIGDVLDSEFLTKVVVKFEDMVHWEGDTSAGFI